MSETITILDMEIDIIVDDFTPFDPGVSSGPAEDCYPPEGGEVEWHVDENFEQVLFVEDALSKNPLWVEDINQQLYIRISENGP